MTAGFFILFHTLWKMFSSCYYYLFLCIVSASFVFAEEKAASAEDKTAVLALNKDTFYPTLAEHPIILVEFYAPWCGHCKALAPHYTKAAGILEEEASEIRLAKVDATVETELAEKFGVKGYPTLLFHKHGEWAQYTGRHTAEEIVTWLKRKAGPPFTTLSTPDEVKAFSESSQVVVIGLFKDTTSKEATVFETAAKYLDEVPFGISSNPEVNAHLGKGVNDGIVLLKKFDEGKVFYEGEYTSEAILNFVKKNRLPLIVDFSQKSVQKVVRADFKHHIFLFISKPDFQAKIDEITSVAKMYRNDFIFMYVNTDVDGNKYVLDFFGLKKDQTPTAIARDEQFSKYKLQDTTVSGEALTNFLEDFKAGKVPPYHLSADEPANWESAPVKVLVGKTFYDRIRGKSAFVIFYAPWCTHSKNLAPIWDQLGEKYKEKTDDIMIAKVDATANEVENVKIDGYPSLKYFPKDSDKPLSYNGPRTLEAFAAFLDSGGKEGYRMSAAEPEDWDAKGVKVLVGNTFYDRVKGKNAFVAFYAPWCAHCKKLLPIWNELGERYHRDSSTNVMIASVDATANEIENVTIEGFPTLLYFPKDPADERIPYNGERTLEAFATFLKSLGNDDAPVRDEKSAEIEKQNDNRGHEEL